MMITFFIILILGIAIKAYALSVGNGRLVNTTLEIPPKNSYHMRQRIGEGEGDNSWYRAINQENDFTWIFHKEYNESKYPSSKLVSTVDSGLIFEDTVTFVQNNNTIIPQFPYYVVDNTTVLQMLHLGSFGFGFKFENESNSIVHQLYNKNYTDHLSYSFVTKSNTNVSHIYFGGIPSEIEQGMKSGICYVDSSKTKWECILKHFTFGAFSYSKPSPIYFQAAEEPIYAPGAFITKMMNHVFDKYINDNICFIVTLKKRETIKCLSDTVKTFPMMNFTIDSYIYSFNATEFFDADGKYSYLNILNNHYSNDTWIFGASFLRHFNALFNYEGRYVKLFSNTRITKIPIEKMIVFYANVSVTCAGIMFLIIWKAAFNKDLRVD